MKNALVRSFKKIHFDCFISNQDTNVILNEIDVLEERDGFTDVIILQASCFVIFRLY